MLQGIGVSSGIGIGTAFLVHTAQPKYLSSISSPQEEKNRLSLALSHVVDKTYTLAQRLADQAGQAQADILLGQITIAQDPFLTAQIHEKIDEGLSAHESVDIVCQMYVEMFSNHKYSYASAQAMFIVFECLVFTMLLNALFNERDDRELKRGRRRLAA